MSCVSRTIYDIKNFAFQYFLKSAFNEDPIYWIVQKKKMVGPAGFEPATCSCLSSAHQWLNRQFPAILGSLSYLKAICRGRGHIRPAPLGRQFLELRLLTGLGHGPKGVFMWTMEAFSCTFQLRCSHTLTN